MVRIGLASAESSATVERVDMMPFVQVYSQEKERKLPLKYYVGRFFKVVFSCYLDVPLSEEEARAKFWRKRELKEAKKQEMKQWNEHCQRQYDAKLEEHWNKIRNTTDLEMKALVAQLGLKSP